MVESKKSAWRPFKQKDRSTWPTHNKYVLVRYKNEYQLAKFQNNLWELNHSMYGGANLNPDITEWCEIPD